MKCLINPGGGLLGADECRGVVESAGAESRKGEINGLPEITRRQPADCFDPAVRNKHTKTNERE